MAVEILEVRPRTTGEILDDAWRAYQGSAPELLALSGLFNVPLAVAVLLVLTVPPQAVRPPWLLAALAAALLPLSGLGSGACQEALRRRTEGKPIALPGCLRAALRHGLNHVAGRAVVLVLALPGVWGVSAAAISLANGVSAHWPLVMAVGVAWLDLIVWVTSGTHAVIAAGESGFLKALQTAAREAQRQPGKAAAAALGRIVLFLFAFLNLALFVATCLWVAENLGGFDLAFVSAVLSVGRNPVYAAVLGLLAWILLAPYGEAVNYLLHVDARARFEGLDLWYRVQRLFPAAVKKAGAKVGVVMVAALLATAARGADGTGGLGEIRRARQEIAAIRQEVKAAEPFRADRWTARLRGLAERLERASRDPDDEDDRPRSQKYPWLRQAIDRFGRSNREGALQVLGNLDQQLGLLEESLAERPGTTNGQPERRSREDIKALLPAEADEEEATREKREKQPAPEKPAAKQPVQRDEDDVEQPGMRRQQSGSLVRRQTTGGLGMTGWGLLLGVLVAVVLVVILMGRRDRHKPAAVPKPEQAARNEPGLESLLSRPDEQTEAQLWRRADDLARSGNFLEAVRTLYLAVLALLHRSNLIRYERPRTNGEYVRQLRSHETLHDPFQRLTGLFELKWYGERSCRPDDFQACRDLAEVIRAEAAEAK